MPYIFFKKKLPSSFWVISENSLATPRVGNKASPFANGEPFWGNGEPKLLILYKMANQLFLSIQKYIKWRINFFLEYKNIISSTFDKNRGSLSTFQPLLMFTFNNCFCHHTNLLSVLPTILLSAPIRIIRVNKGKENVLWGNFV